MIEPAGPKGDTGTQGEQVFLGPIVETGADSTVLDLLDLALAQREIKELKGDKGDVGNLTGPQSW